VGNGTAVFTGVKEQGGPVFTTKLFNRRKPENPARDQLKRRGGKKAKWDIWLAEGSVSN